MKGEGFVLVGRGERGGRMKERETKRGAREERRERKGSERGEREGFCFEVGRGERGRRKGGGMEGRMEGKGETKRGRGRRVENG